MRKQMRGRYPEIPTSDEDSEYTASKEAVIIARFVFVCLAIMVILGLCALILLMAYGIKELGRM